ncbi:hypothetical protein O1611_g8348 [Lasiodiplodia mahajangana]|uniref:Uncharacterized protein n=1 Tax=Lasiodiplodia mahajangana TaxID=1108764 RepID=A0ACC2JCX6_9PEZI|nr:hypothetical protein O1611_g8348 [Lasiodiplodia mahajangana]
MRLQEQQRLESSQAQTYQGDFSSSSSSSSSCSYSSASSAEPEPDVPCQYDAAGHMYRPMANPPLPTQYGLPPVSPAQPEAVQTSLRAEFCSTGDFSHNNKAMDWRDLRTWLIFFEAMLNIVIWMIIAFVALQFGRTMKAHVYA